MLSDLIGRKMYFINLSYDMRRDVRVGRIVGSSYTGFPILQFVPGVRLMLQWEHLYATREEAEEALNNQPATHGFGE